MAKKQSKGVVEKVKGGISRGLGLPLLKDGAQFITGSIRGFLNISHVEQKETFDQAMQRMNLTEDDLAKQITRYWQQLALFLLLALGVLGYAIYLLMSDAIGSGIVALLAMILLVTYALRAHFWIFQIKNRKLGCTLKEWWNNKINS